VRTIWSIRPSVANDMGRGREFAKATVYRAAGAAVA
jgi:hypothetical protein